MLEKVYSSFHARSEGRNPRVDESPSPLARTLRTHLNNSGKSIYRLSNDSGIDAAYIWRVLNNKRHEVSREVLILLSIAFVVDDEEVDAIAEVANDLLDAGGFKMLR